MSPDGIHTECFFAMPTTYFVQVKRVDRQGVEYVRVRTVLLSPFPHLRSAEIVRSVYVAKLPLASLILFQNLHSLLSSLLFLIGLIHSVGLLGQENLSL